MAVVSRSTRSLERMLTKRTVRAIHGGFVSGALVVAIYLVVPQFHELFADFGSNIPAPTRVLMAIYPFAFVIPVIVAALCLLPTDSSRWRYFVVPLVYVFSFAVIGMIAVALYLPVFQLAHESETQHAP